MEEGEECQVLFGRVVRPELCIGLLVGYGCEVIDVILERISEWKKEEARGKTWIRASGKTKAHDSAWPFSTFHYLNGLFKNQSLKARAVSYWIFGFYVLST